MKDFGEIKVGGKITFGSYHKDGQATSEKEPLPWLVLAVEQNRVLVITAEGVDSQLYNVEAIETNWEKCSLRKWLNQKFLTETFTEEEKARILVTEGDCLFLLSVSEAEKYFSSDEARQCKPAAMAVLHDVYVEESTGNCAWWLRDSGSVGECAALVEDFGAINPDGDGVYCEGIAVRPAMWLSLS